MLVLLLLSLLLHLCYLAVPELQHVISPVFIALILGLLAAFVLPLLSVQPRQLLAAQLDTIANWQQKALRLGIVLFAFSVEPELVLQTEPLALMQLFFVVLLILTAAFWLGITLFKLPKELVLLISCGLSFCGTSAIFATWSVRQSSQASLTQSLAVVLLMGLLSLLGYAVLMQTGWLPEAQLAWLIGSTAPEVSQAVAAGSQLGDAAPQAVIAKLFRVCLLVPFLLLLSLNSKTKDGLVFPWFVLAFIAVLVLTMVFSVPAWFSQGAVLLSQSCLIFAMLVTGLLTCWQDLKQCSGKVFIFAALVMSLLFSLSYLFLPG
ncbi:putative sulfate exporter family transporter [Rheinheimera sp. 1928-s]|uniref:YeiH family protein n=1 Tax=Rheinheimera sp. 1928-s TaxID=3033803 RepID=UPI00260A7FF8|nr:putative sulfate exporter family transporter [Rheinheimera sp. 1928-s]MDF3124584.1 putative sulfate exporter family transporter [Rheinheimera sp. 1928-s]